MKKLQAVIYSILLITTPSLLALPNVHFPNVSLPVAQYGYSQHDNEWVKPTTYDEILALLEEIESKDIETKYSPGHLQQINDYLCLLAIEGLLPDEAESKIALNADITDLMYGKERLFQFVNVLDFDNVYSFNTTAIYDNSGYSIVQCGKISHA